MIKTKDGVDIGDIDNNYRFDFKEYESRLKDRSYYSEENINNKNIGIGSISAHASGLRT